MKPRLLATAVLILIVSCRRASPDGARDAAQDCFRYGPDAVTVRGQLVRLVFPGRPNYEDTLRGDEPESGFYLRITPPLCARAGRDEEIGQARMGVDSVQLVLDSAGYATLRPLLGTVIGLRGTLFPAQTGHHHAPVLMSVLQPVRVVP